MYATETRGDVWDLYCDVKRTEENHNRRATCSQTYNDLWGATQSHLTRVLESEQGTEAAFHHDQKGELIRHLRNTYVSYLCVARNLDTCHNLLVQPQKRQLLRHLLDSTLGRIVELKHEIVALDLSDIQHCDDIMWERNLTPADLEVPIPAYIRRERQGLLKERDDFIDDCLKRTGFYGTQTEDLPSLTVSEAIVILQRHERARQGRVKVEYRRDLLAKLERERGRGKQMMPLEEAVICIQAHTRGMLARKCVLEMRRQEEIFLGLRPEPNLNWSCAIQLEKVKEGRYRMQQERKEEYEQMQQRVKSKILQEEAMGLMTSMEDTIREWVFAQKNLTGKFPDLPDEDDGGSATVLGIGQDALPDVMALPNVADVAKAEEKKVSIPYCRCGASDREKAREQAKQRRGRKEEEDKVVTLRPSAFLCNLHQTCEVYQDIWSSRALSSNPQENPDRSMIETEKRIEVENEVRRQVDILMRNELQRLKEDIEGEKKGAKKRKRVKKGGKKGRKRKEKDLTPDRSTESLFEELILNGIIKKVPQVQLAEVMGQINVIGCETVFRTKLPKPCMGDIKNILTEYVILPLGIDAVHAQAPLVKSVLLCGPRGCGKSMLVKALCYEAGATLMDLTASNIVGRYPGRGGLNMLTHLVSKVGRLLQPTIVLVDNADRMFLKKVPKTDRSDPRRMRKELPRILKTIGADDRILFLGLTNSPWNCDIKALSTLYQKMLMVYRPGFGERADLWRHLITKAKVPITPSMDVAALARISEGYTNGHICNAADKVLVEQRFARLDRMPLCAAEFIEPLSKIEPIYREEEEALKTWFLKTPVIKKRLRNLEEEMEGGLGKGKGKKASEKSKKGKGKKGKRKKK
ncbi:IQ and AAA domain-containing protein 1-like [Oratosquilla oratoria]|uniref:IQ and AAA domain-containing protein 1-like n=1 Tax=Oratosquilla oratoria TaxID=337810 RepID=UPI003F75BF83